MDIRDAIQSIRYKYKDKTDTERMAYEYYYLVENISELCTEVQKLHISEKQAIDKIKTMIGKTVDSLEDVEKVMSKKLGS